MTAYDHLVELAAKQSLVAGNTTAPANLVSASAQIERPVEALCRMDDAHILFDAFYRDCDALRRVHAMSPPATPADIDHCAALLRWLHASLIGWKASDDPARTMLASIIVCAQAFDREGGLWPLLPSTVAQNHELLEAVGRVIASSAVVFSAPDAAPIWEREAMDAFTAAEAATDWGAIGERWGAFDHLLHPNAVQTQCVRCLFQFDRSGLVDTLATVRQTAVAMLISRILNTKQRLELAASCINPFVEFAAVYQTINNRQLNLSSPEAKHLTTVLQKVALDQVRWIGWMRAFNAHPGRHPALQTSLGECLASAPDHALEAYVNSIALFPKKPSHDPGREGVAQCLRAFSNTAPASRRSAMWTLAHTRWRDWHFGRANAAAHVLEVSWSELDFAVVGYATECMDQAGRDGALDAIRRQLGQLDNQWHPSVTDLITEWNRLLSKFQPYARATEALKAGEDWLSTSRNYMPFDPKIDTYLAMKYRLN